MRGRLEAAPERSLRRLLRRRHRPLRGSIGGGAAARRWLAEATSGTSKDVATTVTQISSANDSSTDVPKMMFASSATIDEITPATSFTSWRDMSELPVIVKTTPVEAGDAGR